MPEQPGRIESRLSALADFVTFPPTPDLVTLTRAERLQPAGTRWTGFSHFAPLAAGLAAILLIVAAALSASSQARAAVGDLLEVGGLNPFSTVDVYTTRSFEPSFSVTLNHWPILVDTSDAFVPAGNLFGIYRPRGWADPAGEPGYVIPGDIISWLQRHPSLDAGEPTTVTVGGIEGTQIDLGVVCNYCDELFDEGIFRQRSAGPGLPAETYFDHELARQQSEALRNASVSLFYLQDPLHGAFAPPGADISGFDAIYNPALEFTLYPRESYRLIVFEVGGEDLVVVSTGIEYRDPMSGGTCGRGGIPEPCPDFGSLTPFDLYVRPMLDSLVFKPYDPRHDSQRRR